MTEPVHESSTRLGVLKTIIAALVTIIVLLCIVFFWFQKSQTAPDTTTTSIDSVLYNHGSELETGSTIATNSSPQLPPAPQGISKLPNDATTPTPSPTAVSIEKSNSQDDAVQRLDSFFYQIEKAPYYQESFGPEKAHSHFSLLLQKIIDNPPVVSGESDDLFTLLQNTAHFFRILGKNNIELTRGILHDHKPEIETIAADIFTVLNNEEILRQQYAITPNSASLYNYGCFFLNTMGGRLYMFRRELEMRMLLSYYSLLFVYQAELEGENYNGIDLRPFLKSLIYEMENYGQKLAYRDIYLSKLYTLENSLK